ncbi:DEAD-box ATP-dependent RNA helicase 58, chloroplastic [Gracilariopsis chorda]|uniref:DEAD-box ATP-dependent RNA helicase 58, chloroplastic n=1 Tax=Gracilariopsis chorda TaxID=448386 RepID=A0A2V3INY2_9FLOR|nr:DEAD-box ATP-dependent RNA helicase 58, chloroplastic [Gracilariopsis chorda]|eukprot:PXF43795.1 DEAD-box ATP-dependent RNA helicase 58, chloroplastic [Gracilariopsis chorda]
MLSNKSILCPSTFKGNFVYPAPTTPNSAPSHLFHSCSTRKWKPSKLKASRAEQKAVEIRPERAQSFRDAYAGRIQPWLLNRLEQMGFTHPTPVQKSALPTTLPRLNGEIGQDVVIHAQTGSGKTLAYLLPIIATVQPARSATQAMIVVPTQELGMQVYKLLRRLTSAYTVPRDWNEKEHSAYGESIGDESKAVENTESERGVFPVLPMLNQADLRRQKLQLREAAPRVIVGNPHRIAQLVRSKRLRLDLLKVLVVDEFDACLLDTATTSALQTILSVRGREGPRQTILASATVPQHRHFLRQCVRQRWTRQDIVHVWVEQDTNERVPESLSHVYAVCEGRKKLAALRALLLRFNSEFNGNDNIDFNLRAIVFVMTSRNVQQLVSALNAALRQDFPMQKEDPLVGIWDESSVFHRKTALNAFREGSAKVLIGTDVAARGLDVPDISHVFHFDLPTDSDAYLHRAGRTGRQGRPGTSVVLLTPGEQFVISRISNSLSIRFERIGR